MRNKRRRRLTAVAALIASLTLSASSAGAHPTPGARGLPSDSTAQEQVAPGDGFDKSDAGIMAGSAVVLGLGLAMARTRLRPKPAMRT